MHRFLGLIALAAVAAALPTPSEEKLEDIILPTVPFMSSIMLPLTREDTAKFISAAPITNVLIPNPQLRPVMITGDEMSPKVEEALEMKDEPIIREEDLEIEELKPEMPLMENKEPIFEDREPEIVSEDLELEEVMPEMPKEEIVKPETLPDKFLSVIKLPPLSSLLPTFTWPNWSNFLPIRWTTNRMPFVTSSRDLVYPFVLVKDPKVKE